MSYKNEVAQTVLGLSETVLGLSPEAVAVGLLKQAGLAEDVAKEAVLQEEFEKTAAEQLTYKGFDAEEAARLVKLANVKVKDLPGVTFDDEALGLSESLVKVAKYIEDSDSYASSLASQVEQLKANVSDLEKQAGATAKPASDTITKLAQSGAFTNEDLEALKAVPTDVMEKLAAAVEPPWSMGSGAGAAVPKMDPFMSFIMGRDE